MDDELEDKVLYQVFISHMKLFSRFSAVGVNFSSPLIYLWRILRIYILKPEIICGIIVFFLFLIYVQAVEVWSRGLFGKIQVTLGSMRLNRTTKLEMLTTSSAAEKQSWEITKDVSSVYAVQGRRPRMEDRFIIDENIDHTGISLFAIFDGHGGELACDFAKDILIPSLYKKIIETTNILHGKITPEDISLKDKENQRLENEKEKKNENEKNDRLINRRTKKTYSVTEDCITKGNCNTAEQEFLILNKLSSIVRPFGKDLFGTGNNNIKPKTHDAKMYIENGKINFGKMVTDEVLAADFKLIEIAKKTTNVAGTTALIAIMEGTRLIVANVGDSRGIMCDSKGNAIPLSFDHKPQQVRERKRIQEAGGFIAFKGVWRVAGILATSRALGDYPLKDKNLVIADPDILTFDLADHKPSFLILASDGLWDTFSNEEAVAFIKEHIDEENFGAKSLTLQSYYRGSVDNITVLVIKFKNGHYQIGTSSNSI